MHHLWKYVSGARKSKSWLRPCVSVLHIYIYIYIYIVFFHNCPLLISLYNIVDLVKISRFLNQRC